MYNIQGFEAGFDKKDQVNIIVAHIGPLDWEKKKKGTAYIVTRRTRIIGFSTADNQHPTDSA